MSITTGTRIGPYEITSPLGEDGCRCLSVTDPTLKSRIVAKSETVDLANLGLCLIGPHLSGEFG